MSIITRYQNGRKWRRLGAILLIGVFLLPAGCASEPAVTATPTEAAPTAAPATATATAPPPTATARPLPPTPALDPAVPPPPVTHDLQYTVPRRSTVLPESLDVYTPGARQPAGWPVVVMVHGTQQSKEDFRIISEKLADQGTVVFTIDWPTYSVSAVRDGDQVREMSETLICAVRYADAYAPLFGGDPGRIILTGFSLGANAGAMAAVGGADLESAWADIEAGRGVPADPVDCAAPAGDARVDAFIGIGGPYAPYDELRAADPDLWALVSSDGQLGADPSLIVRLLHGNFDGRVDASASDRYAAALTAAGYDAVVVRYDDGHKVPHDLTLATVAELDALLLAD